MERLNHQKQRVLVVGHLPPPQEGTAVLTKIIVKSEYLCKRYRMFFLPLRKRKNPSNRGKFGFENLYNNAVNIFHFVYYIVRFNPRCIYAPLSQNRLGFFRDSIFILAGKFFCKRICIHFHGGSFNLFYENQGSFFKKYIKFILGLIDRLIVLANKFKKQFSPFMDSERIEFLYNCVPKEEYSRICSKENILKGGVKKVLFVGYLSKAKGALDLVKAIPYVLNNYKEPVEFILCGQPVDIERNVLFIPDPHNGYSDIKKLIIRENISSNVQIYPEVITEEKGRLFSVADIFVLPSYSEGCALVVLEAMAFGLPVITTSVGALEEMLVKDENCFFVEPGDFMGLSERILFLLNDFNLCERIGAANKRLIKERYNSDIFLRNLSGIWGKECRRIN